MQALWRGEQETLSVADFQEAKVPRHQRQLPGRPACANGRQGPSLLVPSEQGDNGGEGKRNIEPEEDESLGNKRRVEMEEDIDPFRPRFAGGGYRWKSTQAGFRDGGGLAFAGRWSRETRTFPKGERWDQWRKEVLEICARKMGGMSKLEREFFRMSQGGILSD